MSTTYSYAKLNAGGKDIGDRTLVVTLVAKNAGEVGGCGQLSMQSLGLDQTWNCQ